MTETERHEEEERKGGGHQDRGRGTNRGSMFVCVCGMCIHVGDRGSEGWVKKGEGEGCKDSKTRLK